MLDISCGSPKSTGPQDPSIAVALSGVAGANSDAEPGAGPITSMKREAISSNLVNIEILLSLWKPG